MNKEINRRIKEKEDELECRTQIALGLLSQVEWFEHEVLGLELSYIDKVARAYSDTFTS